MTGWNLPPGVNVSDLPGNRPEDIAAEEFWNAFEEKLAEKDIHVSDGSDKEMIEGTIYDHIDIWNSDWFVKVIEIARDMGFDAGYNQGCADEAMQYSGFEMEVEERLSNWLYDHPRATAKQYIKKAGEIRAEMKSD